MIPVCANIGSQHLVKYALQVASSSNASYARRRCGRQERDFSRQSQVPRKPPITPNRYPVHCAATRGAEQSASQRLSVRLNCAFARNRSGSPGPISHLRFCSPEVRHIRPTSRMSASPTRGRTCAPALVSSSIVRCRAFPLPNRIRRPRSRFWCRSAVARRRKPIAGHRRPIHSVSPPASSRDRQHRQCPCSCLSRPSGDIDALRRLPGRRGRSNTGQRPHCAASRYKINQSTSSSS